MLPFLESLGTWTIATFFPALAGLSLMILIGGLTSVKYCAAFAFGIFLWFFVDTLQGSSDLLVNSGLSGGVNQAAIVILFVVGALLFFWADGRLLSPTDVPAGLIVPLVVAFAFGIHGLGEGSAFGSTAAQTSSSSLLGAFGGVTAGVAYALHKLLEPMMVGAVYLAGFAKGQRGRDRSVEDVILLALVFALPSLAGAAAGYFVSYDATYLFALGAGTSIYGAFTLSRVVFAGAPQGRRDPLKIALATLFGFMLIYLAALVHA